MSIDAHLSELVEAAVSRALENWTPPKGESGPQRADRPRLLTIREAAQPEHMNVSEASIRRLIDAGELPAVRCFTSLRIDTKDIDAWVERAKGTAK